MYFKVDRKILKKALVLLKQKLIKLEDEHPGEILLTHNYSEYIKEIEFALYKTRMDEFYIDYNFAEAIRPALLTKKEIKK